MSWINLVKVILDIANDGPFFEIFINPRQTNMSENLEHDDVSLNVFQKLFNHFKYHPVSTYDLNSENIVDQLTEIRTDISEIHDEAGSLNSIYIEEPTINLYKKSVRSKTVAEVEKNQDDLVDKHEEYVFSRDNILVLINKSQNSSLLRHEKTLSILDDQWKYSPGFFYYCNLILYLTFVVFFSIYIKNYRFDFKLNFSSRCFSLGLSSYFLFYEIIQMIVSIINANILVYLTSFKNMFELFGLSLSVVTLCVENGNLCFRLAYFFHIVFGAKSLKMALHNALNLHPIWPKSKS